MVVIRDGRIVAAGDVRMKFPADTQVIDATGKWVTPGIVAGFSRLGLAEVDFGGRGRGRHQASNGPFNAAIDVAPGDQPDGHAHRGQSRRRSDARDRRADRPARASSPGQGAVIDTGADMDPITAARKFQFVELGQNGAEKAGGSRSSAHVLFRNALREAAELSRYSTPVSARRGARPTSASDRSSAIPTSRGFTGPTRAKRRRASDALRCGGAGPGAAGAAVSAGPCRARERHPPGLDLKREFPVTEDRARRRDAKAGSSLTRSRMPAVPVIASAVNDLARVVRADRGDPVERRPDARRRRQGLDRHDRRQ